MSVLDVLNTMLIVKKYVHLLTHLHILTYLTRLYSFSCIFKKYIDYLH